MSGDLVATAVYATLRVVLQAGSEIDLDYTPYGANDIQFAIAILIGVGVIVVSSLYIKFWSSRILDDEEAEHAKTITNGLRTRDRNRVRIAYDDDLDDVRRRIRELFTGDFESDVPTVRGALAGLREAWVERRRAATDAVRDELPALSRALSLDAVVYLLVGVIVHVSLATWGRVFTSSTTPPDPTVVIERATTAATAVADTTVEIASTFPFAGEIWTFVFLGVFQAGHFVYNEVVAVFVALLVGSVVIWVLDRAVANDVEPRLYRSRPRAAIGVFAVLAGTWFTGVAIAVGLRALHSTIGGEPTAAIVGVVVGVGLVLGVVKPRVARTIEALRVAKEARERYEHALDDPLTDSSTVDDPDEPFADLFDDDPDPLEIESTREPPGMPWKSLAASIAVVLTAIGTITGVVYVTYTLEAGVFASLAGLLASLPVAGLIARRELRGSYDRLTTAYEQANDDGVGPTGTVIYIATRKVFGVIGVFAAAVVPIFVFQAVVSGKLFAVLELALVESSVQMKATIGFVLLVVFVFAIVQTRPAWGDVGASIRLALDRQGLRLALLTRGFPILVVVLAIPMLLGSGFFGPVQSIMLAVGLAVVVKAFLWLKTRAEHAYFELDDEPAKPGRVWIEGVVVEDARGQEIAVASTNGEYIAAPVDPVDDDRESLPSGGVDELVEQLVADTKSIFENVEPKPSVYRYYYDRLDDGRVDFESVRTEYAGTISKAIESEVENAGRDGIDLDRLDEIMSDQFDPELYRRKRFDLQKKADGIAIVGGRVKSN